MTAAPRIETARLALRPHVRADFEAYAAFMASDRARYLGGPSTEMDAWKSFCRDVAQWPLMGCGAWAIEDRETGALLGQVGVNRHPYFPEPELGWLVFDGAEGRGIAREAADAARTWAYGDCGLDQVVSYIHRDNARSITLAERMGAEDDPAAEAPYANHAVYRHPARGAA